MFSNQGQDNEIQSKITDSSNTHPSNWQGPKQRCLFISAHVPFATFRSNMKSGLNCSVHSYTGFESVTSSRKVLCNVFALLACEPVTSSMKASCSVFKLLVCETVTFTTRVSCYTFASLVSELVTSKNQIKRDKSTPTSVGCCVRLEQQCFVLWQQAFFHISIGCCICRLEIKSRFKQTIQNLKS